MRGGIDTRGSWDPDYVNPRILAWRKHCRERDALGWWDPEADQEREWFRIMQSREWEEWTQHPDFKFFPDSPHF